LRSTPGIQVAVDPTSKRTAAAGDGAVTAKINDRSGRRLEANNATALVRELLPPLVDHGAAA